MSERLNIVLAARLDLAIDRVKADASRPAGLMTVNPCTAKMVLVALVDFHGQDGRIYPGIDTLATMACTSWDTVVRVVKLLEFLGVLTVTRRSMMKGQALQDRTNWYEVNWPVLMALAAPTEQVAVCDLLPVPAANGSQSETCSEQVAICDPLPVSETTPSGSQTAPERVADCVPEQVADCVPKPHHQTAQLNRAGMQAASEVSIGTDDDANRARPVQVITEDTLKRDLEQRGGIHGGRARKLARRLLLVEPGAAHTIVDQAIAKSQAAGSKRQNPGAYCATLIEDALATAEQAASAHVHQAVSDRLNAIEAVDAAILDMPDTEIAEAAAASKILRDIEPAVIKHDKSFRRELARMFASRLPTQSTTQHRRSA